MLLALIPLSLLIALQATFIAIWGADSILGASQVALLAAAVAALVFQPDIIRGIGAGVTEGSGARLLSRSVEDSATATVTSPLFPWSSCGMTQATILSVPTLAYAPFCFFNILSPLMSILVGIIGWKIVRKTKPQTD